MATLRNPRYLLRVLNSFDEIYALLMLGVERHFLRTYGGSFTENFYGLKRERVLRIKGGEAPRAQIGAPELMRETLKLGGADVWKNILILVGIPYLKRKLDESFEIHGATQAAVIQMGPNYRREVLSPSASLRQRLFWYYKWLLRKMYPSVNAAYYFSLLAFNLAYLFDNTKYSSPFLWLIGTRIRRLGEADYRTIASVAEGSSDKKPRPGARPQTSSLFNPITFSRVILPQLLSSLKLLLPASIFALKFLEWWHASDFARQLSKKATEGIELPPPIVSGLPNTTQSSSHLSEYNGEASKLKSQLPTNTVALSPPTSTTATPSPPPTSTPPTSHTNTPPPPEPLAKSSPPVSSITHLPIHTVAPPTPSTSAICPICLHPIQTPTSAQTGFVFCYTCIYRWVEGTHERQIAFMEGRKAGDWDDEEDEQAGAQTDAGEVEGTSREGKWESGRGRCAVTGRRVLGGADGLRRVVA